MEYTAYVTPEGQFQFMLFGLKNAPSVFQRAVMNTLGDPARSFVIVNMDMVVSPTEEMGLERLKTVLSVLTNVITERYRFVLIHER